MHVYPILTNSQRIAVKKGLHLLLLFSILLSFTKNETSMNLLLLFIQHAAEHHKFTGSEFQDPRNNKNDISAHANHGINTSLRDARD